MRGGIYARVSTEEQTLNFSIGNQLDRLRKYCSDCGYTIVQEYVDPGFSGTTLQRPMLKKLMEDVRAGSIDIVLVYKLDRLFRSNRHMYNTLAEWEEVGVKFASVTESFDTTTAMGKAYVGMASTFAEWERNTFLERSRDGIRRAVQNGQYSGGIIPYGYQLNEAKKLEVNEEEAEVVRRMYHWLNNEGMSTYAIADRLNILGIPTRYTRDRRGVRGVATANLWTPGRVCNMLKNATYKGEWSYGKRTKKKQPVIIHGSCPAIIDPSVFARAQARMKENNLWADRNAKRVYLLRGLIRCDSCGSRYTGYYSRSSGDREIRYYRCNGNSRGRQGGAKCRSPSVAAQELEDLVWQKVSEFVRDPATVKRIIENRVGSRNPLGPQIERAEGRMKELAEAESRLLGLYADPSNKFSKEALDAQMEKINVSRGLLAKHIQELTEAQASECAERFKVEVVESVLSRLRGALENATDAVKREVIENLLLEATVGRDEGHPSVVLVFAFGAPVEGRNVQLHHAGMPLRLLRAPGQGVQVLELRGDPLPEAHKRTVARSNRHLRGGPGHRV